jgi:hypothetical protein
MWGGQEFAPAFVSVVEPAPHTRFDRIPCLSRRAVDAGSLLQRDTKDVSLIFVESRNGLSGENDPRHRSASTSSTERDRAPRTVPKDIMTAILRRPRAVACLLLLAILVGASAFADAEGLPSALSLDSERQARLLASATDPTLEPWQREFATRLASEAAGPGNAPQTADGEWTVIPPPAGRYGHSSIYDPVRRRMVVFGGYDNFRLNDVWILTLDANPRWTWVRTSGVRPSPRYRQGAIYDPMRDRMLVFGGDDGHNVGDVWALSLAEPMTWSPVATTGSAPPGRREHTVVYDPVRDRMIVYGGTRSGVALSDAWALSLGTGAWSRLDPAGTAPARYRHSAIYDPIRERMVVFGGADSTLRGDAFALSLSGPAAWTLLAAAVDGPSPRSEHGAIYDPTHDRMVVYGGFDSSPLGDAWALALGATPAWSRLEPAGSAPAPHHRHSVVYDSGRGCMVVFGGMSPYKDSEAWALELSGAGTWKPYAAMGTPPTPRVGYSAIYDPVRDRMILFGGHKAASYLGETWALSLAGAPQWSKLSVAGTPPAPRAWHSAVYDPIADRMVVFGGQNAEGCLADVWALALSTTSSSRPRWSPLAPSGVAPTVRERHAAVYDPPRRRMIVWGGRDDSGAFLDDGFSLSLAGDPAWTPLSVPASPPARAGHAAAYDVLRQRVLVYGGFHGTAGDSIPLTDLWSFDAAGPPSWSYVVEGRSPNGCLWMIYDPVRDRLSAGVLAGDSTHRTVETWVLSLGSMFGGTLIWKRIAPQGEAPPTLGSNAIYDPRRDRLVFFGGRMAEGFSGETWALEWRLPLKPVANCRSDVVRSIAPGLVEKFAVTNPMEVTRLVDWKITSESIAGFPLRGSSLIAGLTTETLTVSLPPLPSSRDTIVVAFSAAFAGAEGNDEICLKKFFDDTTEIQASLVLAEAGPGRAHLVWTVAARTGVEVQRRSPESEWRAIARVTPHDGTVEIEDATVESGRRYGYRLVWQDARGGVVTGEQWVDVPDAFPLALHGARPNPCAGPLAIAFAIPTRGRVTLEIFDVAGRRAATRRLDLAAGFHVTGLEESRAWTPGVYLIRLRFGGRVLQARAILTQ